MGATMALGKVPAARRRWVRQVIAYSLGGAASSALVGIALGWLGALLMGPKEERYVIGLALVAVACLTRELLFPSCRIPQVRRQTPGSWAKSLNPTATAALWGIDIGLVFTTWFTFSGVWFLVGVALISGGPAQGAAILLAYWSGRSLSVWLAPLMTSDAADVPDTLNVFDRSRRHAQSIHSGALVVCTMLVILLSTRPGNGL